MKKRIYTRLAAGLLCGALLFTDAASLDVWAVSNNPIAEQTASLEEPASTAETDEEEPENLDQETDKPEGDDTPVIEGGEEDALPVEEDSESVTEEEQPSVSENAVEEEQDSVSENTTEEEANVNSVMEASEEIIASGTSNDISWVIDVNGKLTVTGNGDWERRDGKYAPWYDHRESIRTAEISISERGMTDASYMFFECENLTDINMTNFRAYGVKNMSSMFYGCSKLDTLYINYKYFNTGMVTDMSSMFEGCSNLTEISNLNPRSVTDMSRMFYGCSNLTTLDHRFTTSSATDMSGMFCGCSNLTTLNLRINTRNATNMSGMFEGCRSLTKLDVSNFITYSVTDMSRMFYGCSNLIELDLGSFDMQNVVTAAGMFDDCTHLTCIYTPLNLSQSVSLPSFSEAWYRSDGTEVTELPQNLNYSVVLLLGKERIPTDIASGESNDISWVINADRKLTVSGTGDFERRIENVDDTDDSDSALVKVAPWYDYRGSIRSAEVSVTDMTDASYMFYGCSKLSMLDLSKFNTASVTDMSGMFYGCYKLDTLDISNFSTASVTDMSQMFYDCGNLSTLDVSNFNTASVANMSGMFYNCYKLDRLDVSNFNTASVTDMSQMFYDCGNLSTLDVSNFNTASVANMSGMFYNCYKLDRLDVSNFNTASVTDMSQMFSWCENLSTLDISKFNTGSVTDMSQMFSWCENLSTLDISKFNTSNVTDMSQMFYDCYNLDTLDVSNFNTASVANMSWMFCDCYKLDTLDVSNFNTGNVTNMQRMFCGCENLSTLDVSHFDTSKVTDMSQMFFGCAGLTTLDLGSFDTGSLIDMSEIWDEEGEEIISSMFYNCSNLTTIYTPRNLTQSVILPANADDKWYRSDGTVVTELPQNLDYSVALGRNYTPTEKTPGEDDPVDIASGKSNDISWVIDADGKLTVSGTGDYIRGSDNYAPWYEHANSIKTAEVTVTGMTDASYMFSDCENLNELDVSKFDTSSVKNMCYMFGSCRNLTELDVSSFDTSKVTDMAFMFRSCENLTTLDLSNFNTENVTNMRYMFYWCTGLTTVDVSSFDTGKVTDMCGMFDHCYSLKMLDVRSFNTENVTDMERMFHACASVYLTTLDLSSFDVGNVINMTNMITSCPFLTQINTPRNVKQIVDLPTNSAGIKWYLPDGTEVTILPQNLDYSVVLSIIKPNCDPKDDNNDDVLPEDIPKDGVIPKGLWISEIADHTYTGTAIKPEVRVYEGKTRLKQGIDYTLSYKNNTKAARADDVNPPAVVVKGKGNYSGTETKTFNIAKRDISDIYVTKTFTDAYAPLENGSNPNLVFSAKCNNKALKKNTDYTLKVKDNTGNEVTSYAAVGIYTAVVKGSGNYTGEYTFPFEVLKKVPVSKLKIAKIAAVKYDGTSKTPEPVITYGKVTLNKGTDYTLSYLNNTAVGTATIVITGMGDYFGTRNVTFSITGLPIKQAKFTGFINSFPYTGDKLYQNEAVLMYGAEKLVHGTDYTVSYSNCQDKGKAAVTYTGIGKYTGTIKKTYSITAYNIKTDAQKRIKLSTDNISAVYTKGGVNRLSKCMTEHGY